MAKRAVRTADILDGYVGLDLECLDRIYLNGCVPNLQVGGQVVQFLASRGFPIPSPAVINRIGDGCRRAVRSFADANQVPVIRFAQGDRKIEKMKSYLARQEATGRSGVAGIGWAQEFQRVATCTVTQARSGGAPHFGWDRAERRVTCYYFYVWDIDFGPAFVKISAYFPYPIKVWLNGHEWAKRQASEVGIGWTGLANGFATCEDPAGLQAICDLLGSGQIQGFFDRWLARLPLPLGPADRSSGYWWELSMRQVEVSKTMVFDCPRNGRASFEALVGRQPRPGPPRASRVDLRQEDPAVDARRLRHPGRHPRRRYHHQRRLQTLPHQGVLQRRPRVADRDRGQRPNRSRRAAPAGPSTRAASESP
jgi:hypothetical protein